MRSTFCEIDMHKECKPSSSLDCGCRCHYETLEVIKAPDVRRQQFGFSLRDDGQVVLLSEDDGNWFPVDSFSPAWLMDLSNAAADAAKRFHKSSEER